jgi:hypothetical protein
MPKTKIKKKDVWRHKPTGEEYTIIKSSKIKLPHAVVGNSWFPAVTYKDKAGNVYNRFIDDFLNKFEFAGDKKNKKEKKKDGKKDKQIATTQG